MKSTLLHLFFAFGMIAGILGCRKTNNIQKENSVNELNVVNEFGISTDGKMLKFNTLQDYERTIGLLDEDSTKEEELLNLVKSLKFENYFSKHLLKTENISEEMDEFFGQLLSVDGTIQIENHIYKIDLPNEKVYVIESQHIGTDYNDLLVGNTQNKRVKEYSVGDDVLYLVNGEEMEKCGGVGGGFYTCYDSHYDAQTIKTFSNGIIWKLYPYARFFRAGVYFKLSSQYEVWRFTEDDENAHRELVHSIAGNGVTIEMFIKSPQAWWKSRPCNSSSIGTKKPGFHYSNSTHGYYNKAVYQGVRNLNGYYFFVQGRAKYPDGSSTLASPYGGRNINSPY